MTGENHPRIRSIAARTKLAAVRLFTSATTVVGLLSLGGFLAAWAWPFELFCHFRVQYSVLFVTLAVVFAGLRNWRWAGVAVALAVVNGREVLPFCVASHPVPDRLSSTDGLRIVSANLFSGNSEPEEALAFLRQCDADVMAFYEVTPAWERRLSDALPGFPYQYLEPQAGNFGIAVYSRRPFKAVEFHALSANDLAIHAEFNDAGMHVHLIAAHAYPPGGSRTALRDEQLRQLGKLAGEVSGPLVVVGDLNVTPFSPSFRELCATGRLRDARRGNGVCPTWPAGRTLLAIPIDHCLVRDCQATFGTGPDIGSDHLPLKLDVWIGHE